MLQVVSAILHKLGGWHTIVPSKRDTLARYRRSEHAWPSDLGEMPIILLNRPKMAVWERLHVPMEGVTKLVGIHHRTPAEAVTQGKLVKKAAAANLSAMAQVQQQVKVKCRRPVQTRAGN